MMLTVSVGSVVMLAAVTMSLVDVVVILGIIVRAAVGMGVPTGIPMGIGMGWYGDDLPSHRPMRILLGFLINLK